MTPALAPRPVSRARRSTRALVRVGALLVAVVVLPALARPAGTEPGADKAWPETESGRFLFFAVLEGLFLDGVQDSVVDAVLDGPPPDPAPATGTPPGPAREPAGEPGPESAAALADWYRYLERTVFVPGCPLCTPSQAAFATYRARGSFHLKPPAVVGLTRDSFGKGLPDGTVAQLLAAERTTRLDALHALVERWVKQAFDRRRATPAERERFSQWMADGRKQGLWQLREMLRERPELAATWPSCAFCDAAVDGCEAAPDVSPAGAPAEAPGGAPGSDGR